MYKARYLFVGIFLLKMPLIHSIDPQKNYFGILFQKRANYQFYQIEYKSAANIVNILLNGFRMV
jgi:hypothetical protein